MSSPRWIQSGTLRDLSRCSSAFSLSIPSPNRRFCHTAWDSCSMWIQAAEVQIFADVIGSGEPLLVMHGGLGLDHTYLRSSPLQQLANTAQLIFYDHRGNGHSNGVDDWTEITHHTWVEDAERIRRSLGYDRVNVFGHSYGG